MTRINISCRWLFFVKLPFLRKDPISPTDQWMTTIVVRGRLCFLLVFLESWLPFLSFSLIFCFLQMMDGTQINIDVTALGAIIALGLMYLKVTLWQEGWLYIFVYDFMSALFSRFTTLKKYSNDRLNCKRFYPGFVSHEHISNCNMWGPTS